MMGWGGGLLEVALVGGRVVMTGGAGRDGAADGGDSERGADGGGDGECRVVGDVVAVGGDSK